MEAAADGLAAEALDGAGEHDVEGLARPALGAGGPAVGKRDGARFVDAQDDPDMRESVIPPSVPVRVVSVVEEHEVARAWTVVVDETGLT